MRSKPKTKRQQIEETNRIAGEAYDRLLSLSFELEHLYDHRSEEMFRVLGTIRDEFGVEVARGVRVALRGDPAVVEPLVDALRHARGDIVTETRNRMIAFAVAKFAKHRKVHLEAWHWGGRG